MSKKEEKVLTLEQVKAKLEKSFGKGTIMGAKDKAFQYESIETGSIGLDNALGIGGLPVGRIVEIYGPESAGKSTLCMEIIKHAQIKYPDKVCAIIDAEHSLDLDYAEKIGVDLDKLQISQPDYGEQAFEIADELISSNLFSVVVVDSVAALVPKAELDGDYGDSNMGKHARLMSQAMRKLTGITSKSDTLLIFTNQMRDKIGIMFGDPSTTTGGNALKFYASVRLHITRSTTSANSVMDGDLKIGNLTKVRVVKNKVAPPFRECEFYIRFGEGIDEYSEVVDLAIDSGIFQKSGSWISYEENKVGQGKEQVRTLLMDNEELFNEIKEKLKGKVIKEFTPTNEMINENGKN